MSRRVSSAAAGATRRRNRHHRAERVRRALQYIVLFVLVAVFLNALAGDRGIIQMLRVRREAQQIAASVAALRAENAALQQQARLLREDPDTIEHVARQELGLIRRGEVVVILKDAGPETTRR